MNPPAFTLCLLPTSSASCHPPAVALIPFQTIFVPSTFLFPSLVSFTSTSALICLALFLFFVRHGSYSNATCPPHHLTFYLLPPQLLWLSEVQSVLIFTLTVFKSLLYCFQGNIRWYLLQIRIQLWKLATNYVTMLRGQL